VTEPEGKSAVVMLWGYVQETKKWVVNVVDFEKVIDRKCEGMYFIMFKFKKLDKT
jgi:hypothetical protein